MSDAAPKIELELRVLGEKVRVSVDQPPEQSRLDQLLPLVRAIDDAVIGRAERKEETAGRTISCCAGCSACCRAQPVPVTPPEAYGLLLLVESLPELRQAEVRQRFTENVQRLEAARLKGVYLDRDPQLDAADARAIAERYFRLGLVCPFLEDDRCSIYADRPFVCRQYLVTSPAALCSDPFQNPVQPVPIPLKPAHATLQIAGEQLGRPQFTIPLALALEYAEAHREELSRTYAAEPLARRWISLLLSHSNSD
jgi:Fe-S-cluster containining protein